MSAPCPQNVCGDSAGVSSPSSADPDERLPVLVAMNKPQPHPSLLQVAPHTGRENVDPLRLSERTTKGGQPIDHTHLAAPVAPQSGEGLLLPHHRWTCELTVIHRLAATVACFENV